MKKHIIFLSCIFLSVIAFGQSRYPIRADTVVIEKIGGSAELIVKNSTRDSVRGILSNVGGGRTAFLRVRVLNDSSFVIAGDTVTIKGTGGVPPIDDVTLTIDDFTVVDTSTYSTECTTVSHFYSQTFPEYIGKRIRVTVAGAVYTTNTTACFYYRFNSGTGLLKIYPAFDPDDNLYPVPGFDKIVKISTY